MTGPTRAEILKRIDIEEARIVSAYRNIEALTVQAGKSQDELIRLYAQLDLLPEDTTVA